jgi:hypothetical protein
MSRVARTVVAGVSGAVQGVVLFAIACALVAMVPPVMISYANRGTVDLDAFLPHTSPAASASTAQVKIIGTPEEQAAIRKVIDQLAWPVDPTSFSVKVVPPQKLPPSDMGMYVYPESVILIDSEVVSDPERQNLTHIMAHEIGHMVDFRYLDDETRAEFMQVRGFSQSADWRGAGAEWGMQPQEDFAEVYAALDAPFSLWPIQTIGGRIEDPVAMHALIDRFQSGPSRPLSPVSFTSVMSRADSAAAMIKGDQVILPLLVAFAALYMCICSIRAMNRAYAQGPARRRPSIETAIARSGAQPALVSARPRRNPSLGTGPRRWGHSATG